MSVFRKKANPAPASASAPVPPKTVVEITDAERLALIYRTLPVTSDAIDQQLLEDIAWVRRKRLTALLHKHAMAVYRQSFSVIAYGEADAAKAEIEALFEEAFAGK